MPQLYWEIGKKVADYQILVKWWSENSFGKNLYIGLYASQLANAKAPEAWRRGNELARQLSLNKQYPQVDGAAFFSAKEFVKNKQGLNDTLKINYYKYPAICPINRNTTNLPVATQPQNIRTLKDRKQAYLVWDDVYEEGGNAVAYYVVYAFKGKKVGNLNDASAIIARTTENSLDLRGIETKIKGNYTFVVTAVNKYKVESIPNHGVTRKF
jgi:hypothetical protein